MNKTPKNKAFTLIEVLIVTAVISLMASIVSAQVTESRQKAEDAHMKTETQQVRNAVEQYRQRTGSVPIPQRPEGGNYTGAMVSEGTDEYESAMQQLVAEKLIPSIPTSPSGQSYSYLATTDEKQAVFAAVLNNDSSGGSSSGGSSPSNVCDSIEGNVEYTWGNSCEINTKIVNCNDYEGVEGFECFDVYDDNYLLQNCDGAYSLNEDFPDFICSNNIMCNAEGCYPGQFVTAPGSYICEFEASGAVCSGTSDSDYCSCI